MKLSMWSSYFFDLSPEEAVLSLAAAGWRHCELSDEHSKVLLERGQPERVGSEFAAFAASHGVAVEQGHLFLVCDIAPGNEIRRRQAIDELKPWLDLFTAIGIRAGVLHPGGLGSRRKGLHVERLKSLSEITDHLAGTDLHLCLENCNSGDELKPLLAETDPSRVGVCLDTGHLNMTSENQVSFIESVAARLRALHLAENAGKADEHMLPYARGGSVPWSDIASALQRIGYSGLHNFEIPGENRCSLPVRRLKLDYLKELAKSIFA